MNLKTFLAIFLVLAVFLGGLQLPPVLADENDQSLFSTYRPIWQESFCKRNNFTSEEFAAMIAIRSEEIMRGNWSHHYRVDYTLKRDWVEIRCHDQVMVFMRSEADVYRHLNIPRDKWFSADEFAMAIDKRLDNTETTTVSTIKSLAFSSLEAAKQEVTDKTGIIRFLQAEVAFYVPGKLPRTDGDPYLLFIGSKIASAAETNQEIPGIPDDVQPCVPLKKPAATSTEAKVPAQTQCSVSNPPDSCEDPAYTGGFAPERASGSVDEKVLKGWLNLVTGALESHEDSLINY